MHTPFVRLQVEYMFVRTYVQLLQMFYLLSRAQRDTRCIGMRYIRNRLFSIMMNIIRFVPKERDAHAHCHARHCHLQ